MFNSSVLRDHATLVGHLADLFDAEDFKTAEDLDYLLAFLNTRHHLHGKLCASRESRLVLAAIATIAESDRAEDIPRLEKLREFLLLTGSCDDDKFAAVVTEPMEAEIAARLAKPQAVIS